MKRKITQLNFLEFVNTFSILVLLGSFTSFSFFSKLYLKTIDYRLATILGLGCWWVYTLDHLWDGISVGERSNSLRHFIHFSYKKPLSYILLFLFLILLLCVIIFVPFNIIRVGLIVAGLTGVHFLINHLFIKEFKKGFFFKEGMIAFVATIGFCLLPTFLDNLESLIRNWVLDTISFFLLSFANLLLFTIYDYDLDKSNNFISSAQVFGLNKVKRAMVVLLLLAFIINLINYLVYNQNEVVLIVISSMQLMLLAIFCIPSYFAINERFRFWGDFIYLFPGFALPFL